MEIDTLKYSQAKATLIVLCLRFYLFVTVDINRRQRRQQCRMAAVVAMLVGLGALAGFFYIFCDSFSETSIVGVSNKHQLVNLYLLRVRPGWCAKGHKVYTGSGKMSYVQFAATRVISTEKGS